VNTIPFLNLITGFLFITVRLSGLMLFAPFFSSESVSVRIKAALVVALSVVLYPLVMPRFPTVPLSHWPLLVLGELLVGSAIGIATSLVFEAVQMAGQILSVQMGYSLVSILDPNTQAESTVVATFHQALAMLIFLRMDVHLWILRALAHSFVYLPPGSAHLSPQFVRAALSAAAAIFTVGVQLAAPVLTATFLADLVLGLLGKASPQLPVMLLGPAIKSLLGLSVLAATLQYWPSMFQNFFVHSVELTENLLHLAR
jgi:flagellar biosynthetic protein FliR